MPEIVPQPGPGKRSNKHRRATIDPTIHRNIGYIGDNNVRFSCSNAAPYYAFNGQLLEYASGLPLSVNPGVPYINFTIAAQGSISTRFQIVDDVLHWYNPQFLGGEAIFCVVGRAIFATFAGTDRPTGCVIVQLVLLRGQCPKPRNSIL